MANLGNCEIHSEDQQNFYLVATRPIREDEVIIEEYPLIIAPNPLQKVCLGCLSTLTRYKIHTCSKCEWLLCSKRCELNLNHTPECHYGARRNKKLIFVENMPLCGPFSFWILMLRCFYQKNHCLPVWERLNRLKSFLEEQKNSCDYEAAKKNVMFVFYTYFGLQEEFTEEEIMKVWAICLTHPIDIPAGSIYPKGIYEANSLLEHNCVANCYKAIDALGVSRVRAGLSIEKGERLTLCYANPLWRTEERQIFLKTARLECNCCRCSDPMEFGTNVNALNCVNFKCPGVMSPNSELSRWSCEKCRIFIPKTNVERMLNRIRGSIPGILATEDYRIPLGYLHEFKPLLHRNHTFMLLIKLRIIHTIGYLNLHRFSDEDLILKLELCRELTNFLERIAPAEKRCYGFIMFDYQCTLEELDRRRVQSGDPSVDVMHNLTVYKQILEEVAMCFKDDSAFEIEGKICIMAKYKLQLVEYSLKS